MSIAGTGRYFLGIIRPVNETAKILNDPLAPQNLDTIHSTTGALFNEAQDTARRFDDSNVIWPDVVDEKDVDSLRDYFFRALPAMNSLEEVASLDQANAIALPVDNESGAASQRIRLRLNLSADTAQGC